MSVWFHSPSGKVLWNASTRAAEFYIRGIRSLEAFLERESGLTDIREDQVTVEPVALAAFIDTAQEQLSHAVMWRQAMGLLAISTVLLTRCDAAPKARPMWEQLDVEAKAISARMPD